jgi:hypothetical protein
MACKWLTPASKSGVAREPSATNANGLQWRLLIRFQGAGGDFAYPMFRRGWDIPRKNLGRQVVIVQVDSGNWQTSSGSTPQSIPPKRNSSAPLSYLADRIQKFESTLQPRMRML